jgi:hypothetical protein
VTSSAKNRSQVPDGISAMLLSYQEVVRFLLRQDDYPGVTAEELEFFKSQFRTSAYTCRLSSCPRTTVGFRSEELLREHEVSHARRIACTFPDCKYPPFGSVQALKNHVNKYHYTNPAPKSIRKVGHFLSKTSTATNSKKRTNPDASITNYAVNRTVQSALDPPIAPEYMEYNPHPREQQRANAPPYQYPRESWANNLQKNQVGHTVIPPVGELSPEEPSFPQYLRRDSENELRERLHRGHERPQNGGNTTSRVQQMILTALNSQQTQNLTGWQSQVSIQERMGLMFSV